MTKRGSTFKFESMRPIVDEGRFLAQQPSCQDFTACNKRRNELTRSRAEFLNVQLCAVRTIWHNDKTNKKKFRSKSKTK